MKRFRLFTRSSRGGGFYCVDSVTGKHTSLGTKDPEVAERLLHAKNEAHVQPAINLQIAKAYLAATDPQIAKRKWKDAFQAIIDTKHGETKARWLRAQNEEPFDLIRNLVILETQADHLFAVLKAGTVSTNVHLRKLHNFCLDMNWLPWPIIPKKQWPPVHYGEKRAITFEEHQKIIERERNPERKAFYQLCWHLGGAQSDIAALKAEDINWEDQTLFYRRKKNSSPVLIHFGSEAAAVLSSRPSSGPLFPCVGKIHEKHRAKDFKFRCQTVEISGVTLHSYRYAWAERARTAGMPERFAQEALGHGSKAVHRAYAKKALVKVPSLEDYEQNIIRLPKTETLIKSRRLLAS